MNPLHNSDKSRRQFLQKSALAALGLGLTPGLLASEPPAMEAPLMKRSFGRLGFQVTTLGLGGQASLQWTPEGTDPVAIIEKAYRLGINYFDTSNLYGPSQANYGKAFSNLGLVPGKPNYDPAKRKAIFLTSKTALRFGKGGDDRKAVQGNTNGPAGSKALDDVRRTLSLVFGDGLGNYPAEAYLDMVLIHALGTMEQVDALYEGYHHPDPAAPTIGALAALRDVRDGTNRTGLNPKKEKLIRHVGFSGHSDAAVMMEMIQRDSENLLDGMLIAINANDKQYFNMQYNVIPVAAARNMGIIAMKVFADGAMYSKKAEWSRTPEHVVMGVGSSELPADHLIRYSLTTPGIHTAIIGIGCISDDPARCQLTFNLKHAQVKPGSMNEADRAAAEQLASKSKDGKTNYFQKPYQELTPPREVKAEAVDNGTRITWHTAYAGAAPLDRYEVWRDGKLLSRIPYQPQTTKEPFQFLDRHANGTAGKYVVKVIDKQRGIAEATV
ncbi:MAG: aldo/keto reductase [Marinilabiliales bacterium]|nr:aldo/keto reductase [Marinilabiliales bacterium]